MTAFTQFPHSEQQNSCIVENLTPFDILVCDKSWQQREFLTLDEHRMLWAIITAWQKKDIGAVEALAMLDNSELLDPDALMMGFAAFQTAMAQRPQLPPTPPLSPAPSVRCAPSDEILEAVVGRRVA